MAVGMAGGMAVGMTVGMAAGSHVSSHVGCVGPCVRHVFNPAHDLAASCKIRCGVLREEICKSPYCRAY